MGSFADAGHGLRRELSLSARLMATGVLQCLLTLGAEIISIFAKVVRVDVLHARLAGQTGALVGLQLRLAQNQLPLSPPLLPVLLLELRPDRLHRLPQDQLLTHLPIQLPRDRHQRDQTQPGPPLARILPALLQRLELLLALPQGLPPERVQLALRLGQQEPHLELRRVALTLEPHRELLEPHRGLRELLRELLEPLRELLREPLREPLELARRQLVRRRPAEQGVEIIRLAV